MRVATIIVAGAGPDGLGEALEGEGATVVRVTGIASADSLSEADVEDADLLVLTDVDGTMAIAVAKEQNPDVRVVTHAYDTLPGSARGQADLAIDPNLLAVDVVAGELV